MQDPAYAPLLEDAIYQERRRGNPEGARYNPRVSCLACAAAACGVCPCTASTPCRPHSLIADQLAVNIGTELLNIVPGRVGGLPAGWRALVRFAIAHTAAPSQRPLRLTPIAPAAGVHRGRRAPFA